MVFFSSSICVHTGYGWWSISCSFIQAVESFCFEAKISCIDYFISWIEKWCSKINFFRIAHGWHWGSKSSLCPPGLIFLFLIKFVSEDIIGLPLVLCLLEASTLKSLSLIDSERIMFPETFGSGVGIVTKRVDAGTRLYHNMVKILQHFFISVNFFNFNQNKIKFWKK